MKVFVYYKLLIKRYLKIPNFTFKFKGNVL